MEASICPSCREPKMSHRV
ncbi:hypothetical protein, partial [Candidatus Darwinibacter acetoxidans]